MTLVLLVNAAVLAASYSNAGASAYARAKNWQGLVQYASGWTQAEPNNPDAWAWLGTVYGIDLNQPAKAVDPIKRSVALRPSAPAWHALGVTYIQVGQFANGVDAIRHAIQLNPNQPTYWNNLAVAYTNLAQWNNALDALKQEQNRAAANETSYGWYTLGNGFQHLKQQQSAAYAYRQALRMNPRLSEAWNNLGIALQAVGDTQNALDCFHRASALGDSFGTRNYNQLKQALAQAAAQRSNGGGTGSIAARLNGYQTFVQHQWALDGHPGTPH